MSKIRLRKKIFVIKFLKILIHLFTFVLISMFYCEYVHYFVVLYKCEWPKIHKNGEQGRALHVMSVADTHLLGKRHGHWFDKLRREWQMHRAFQSSMIIHNPDVVIFLGDLFDEGKWCSEEEFKMYVKRFHDLFYVPNSVEVLIAAGNHDIGFHYSVNPYLTNRFEEAFKSPAVFMKSIKNITFVAVNSMAMHGDDCFLCKPARLKIEAISKMLRCAQGYKVDCEGDSKHIKKYTQPILLQHYPLYRESDATCSEPDEAPPEEKYVFFREKWECLSKESSDMLLRELQPRLVLSGHTHHGCRIVHNFTVLNVGHTEVKNVPEYTVPSFSWRNKKNPTFAMITVTSDDYAVYKCHMPNENTVYMLYAIFGIMYVAYIFVIKMQKFRVSNFLYTKCNKKS